MKRNVESCVGRKVGSLLSRRELLAALAGGGGAAWITAPRGAGTLAGMRAAEAADEPPRYGGVLTQSMFADAPHFDLHQS